MANKCFVCGKGALSILQVSHAKQRKTKWVKPNLHNIRIEIDGQKKTVKMCSKCLRKYKAGLIKIS